MDIFYLLQILGCKNIKQIKKLKFINFELTEGGSKVLKFSMEKYLKYYSTFREK